MTRKIYTIFAVNLSFLATTAAAQGMDITPFAVVNRSPIVQSYGIPRSSDSTILRKGASEFAIALDNASSYTTHKNENEAITLDGETTVTTIGFRYGIAKKMEFGVSMPIINHGGGFLDQFIINWHNTFSLPQGGRDSAPKNRLNYRYEKNGITKISRTSGFTGIGDISISAGYELLAKKDTSSQTTAALRAELKLPTGDSQNLAGSGSTDLALSCTGGYNRETKWGGFGVFGSFGIMGGTKGDILPDQQKRVIPFGTLGGGWSPAEWISLKLQLNGHSALYNGSNLTELATTPLLLTSGGTVKVWGSYLDIGVSEDVAVATAPDVAFHLRLRREF